MDDLISVTCRLAQNFTSQGWATKEGVSKSQIPLEDVLGVMYGSVDVFSWRTVTWEPVSVEEGDLDHPPGTLRPDACASATQGMVKPDRATANRAPRALGKDEALRPSQRNRGPPLHVTAPGCDVHGPDFVCTRFGGSPSPPPIEGLQGAHPIINGAPPRAILPGHCRARVHVAKCALWHRLHQGHWRVQEVGHIPELGESPARGVVCGAVSRRPGLKAQSCVCVRGGATASLHDPTCVRRASGADARISSVLPLFRAAGFPTRAGLAADPGIQAYVADPQPPSPAHTAAGKAHASPRSAVGVSRPQPASTPSRPLHTPLRAGRSPVLSRPSVGASTPRRRDRTAPPPHQQALPQSGALRATPPHCGCPWVGRMSTSQTFQIPSLAPLCQPPGSTPQGGGPSGGPPGEDAQAVRSSEPHPIAGGRPTPLLDTLDSALLHVVQHAAHSGGLSPGNMSLTPWDFDPQGNGVLPWLLLWVHVLISWACEDMRMAPGSDHWGTIVNMYLELSRTEWWALSDWHEVLSEWCKGASMLV
ncbi:hypothetical protein K439DRAFT_1623705 [Ramaria rubella]|nr:hypothetical protein K439DRAFT_1623705 [Ramaria rubella]